MQASKATKPDAALCDGPVSGVERLCDGAPDINANTPDDKNQPTPAGDNRLPVLAAQIKIEHAGVKAAAQVAAEHAIKAGHALIEAKELVSHGQWLPWLRANVGFSDRTAQLYMKIVRLGFKSATVADLGLKMAANTIAIIETRNYDPFIGCSEAETCEWLLFGLYLRKTHHPQLEDALDHLEWLLQGRRMFPLPDDWLGEKGTIWRTRCGYGRFARPTAEFLEGWSSYREINCHRPLAELRAEIDERIALEKKAAVRL